MSRPRLLLVEDDASIRRFVTLALEDEALDVVEAPTLADAVRALRGPPFAIVMCDLMLPDGSGLDLLRELAQPGRMPRGFQRRCFGPHASAAGADWRTPRAEQTGLAGRPVGLRERCAGAFGP